MDTRREALSKLEVCRFCLSQSKSLIPLYDKDKIRTPKTAVPFALKILSCVAVEIFPSDRMPQYICEQCKLLMEISYSFKQICRQADEAILQYIQHGNALSPLTWPSHLTKVYKSVKKNERAVVKTVVEGGVKVMAQEVSDSEEGEDDKVYNIKIGDGSEDCKSIKIITTVNKEEKASGSKRGQDSDDGESKEEESLPIIKSGCWACDECESAYPLEQLLAIHKAQKHRQRAEECDECGRKFFTKYDMMAHKVTHSSEQPFECVVCQKKFRRLLLLKRHEKQMHGEQPQHSCTDCPATFLSPDELELHQSKHATSTAKPFICFICDKGFHNKVILQRHTEFVHNKKPAFSCQYCRQRFASVSKLTRHLRDHAGARSYPCKYCSKSFTKSHHYTRHVRLTHRAVAMNSYRCEECGATFRSQDQLLYHSALHATKNLVCPLCQEKFENVDAVTAHIKSHVSGAEFMCDFCELIFTSKEKLDGHVASAHNEELLANAQETEHDESSMDMDAEYDDEENSIKVKEENGHMVVEITNTDEYMLPTSQRDEEEKTDQTQSEDSDVTTTDSTNAEAMPSPVTQSDATPVTRSEATPVTQSEATPVTQSEATPVTQTDTGPVTQSDAAPVTQSDAAPVAQSDAPVTPADKPAVNVTTDPVGKSNTDQPPSILLKVEEMRRKIAAKMQTSNKSEKKDKSNMKVESSTGASGASDKSLRLLEKELQDLKRTNTVKEAAKTPMRAVEASRTRRPQIFSSTPKPKPNERKDAPTPKPTEKVAPIEKKVERKLTKDTKELKEVKTNNNNVKEDKELKDKSNGKENKDAVREDKKETKTVVKNGAAENSPVAEEAVRRSNRPSRVKDYAKMIRDNSLNSDEDSEEEDTEEDSYKEVDKTPEPRRGAGRGRVAKPPPSPAAPAAPAPAAPAPAVPAPAPRKRGRPRKEPLPIVPPPKVKKDDPPEEHTETEAAKVSDSPKEVADETKGLEANMIPLETNRNVVVSPSGQTLKKIPLKSLPPGVKPLPLPVTPRLAGGREVCEMQIGKKVVKVQKIVMTKAEVEAMAKKGLVEMKELTLIMCLATPNTSAVNAVHETMNKWKCKDGTMVLKQGIKLPVSDPMSLKSKLVGHTESKPESPSKEEN